MAKARGNSPLNRFYKSLPQDRIDPTAWVVVVVELLAQCLRAGHFRLQAGQEGFETARKAVLYLLNYAHAVNRLGFWDDLELPSKLPSGDALPKDDERSRWKKIAQVRDRLREGSPTQRDLLVAMDVVDEAFRSMHLQFTFGRMLNGFEGVSHEDRYMCAALLPQVVVLLDRVWLPLRSRIPEQEKFRRGQNALG